MQWKIIFIHLCCSSQLYMKYICLKHTVELKCTLQSCPCPDIFVPLKMLEHSPKSHGLQRIVSLRSLAGHRKAKNSKWIHLFLPTVNNISNSTVAYFSHYLFWSTSFLLICGFVLASVKTLLTQMQAFANSKRHLLLFVRCIRIKQ